MNECVKKLEAAGNPAPALTDAEGLAVLATVPDAADSCCCCFYFSLYSDLRNPDCVPKILTEAWLLGERMGWPQILQRIPDLSQMLANHLEYG